MAGYDPQLLATFLAVEQTGSFTRAAARLGIQQPTVSQHIRRLEEQVGRHVCSSGEISRLRVPR
jgi:DNA-binding transcriptional LysR family regulator